MRIQQEVIPIGDELGILLPESVIKSLGVTEGDTLFMRITDDGCCITRGPGANTEATHA